MLNERLKPPSLAKYFFALTSSERGFHDEAESLIEKRLGELDYRSEIISFSAFSTYYDQELGGPCWKYLVSLKELLPVDRIVRIKLCTEEMETALSCQDEDPYRRTVNIDPGYLNGWQVVLASVKIHSHRLYMDDGVYCEVTLLYQDKEFTALPWTYRDYQSPPFLSFLKRERAGYMRELRKGTLTTTDHFHEKAT